MATRVSWWLTHGVDPHPLLVLHKCDNPPCTNPDHLFLGTVQANSNDMVSKGRSLVQNKFGAKLTEDQVAKMRALHASGVSLRKLGLMFRTAKSNVSYIVNLRTWCRKRESNP